MLAEISSITEIDFAQFDLDEPLPELWTNGERGALASFVAGGKDKTLRELVTGSGMFLGLLAGTLIAYVLVKLLTGVFDPPPEVLSVPWFYLAALIVTAAGAALLAATGEAMRSRTHITEKLRGE
jgi:hypothetical protein